MNINIFRYAFIGGITANAIFLYIYGWVHIFSNGTFLFGTFLVMLSVVMFDFVSDYYIEYVRNTAEGDTNEQST